MSRREELTDEQWSLIEPLFDKAETVQTRGRPRRNDREILNGVLWILRSGARWSDMPARFPPYQTCHRRFQQWNKDGTLRRMLETLAEDLHSRGGLDLSECFIDVTFIVAKKGASEWERPSGAKVRSSWQWQTLLVFLSPFTQKVLLHMKSGLSKKLSVRALPTNARKS
jgi:transposase